MIMTANTTSSRKAKGRRLQDHVRQAILEAFPELEEGDIKCAIMGESGQDIHLSPAARKKFPFSVECKNTERLNIWSAIKQAESHSDTGTPLVVFKRNRSKTYAVLELDALLKILTSGDDQ